MSRLPPARPDAPSSVSVAELSNEVDEALREEPQLSPYDLSELLPDASEATVAAVVAQLEAAVAEFVASRDEFSASMSPAVFLQRMRLYEEITEQMGRLSGYGSLWFAANTQDTEALAYRNRIDQVITRLDNRMLFFEIWWKSLTDGEVERLLPTADEAGDFRHFLLELRRFKPHTLDEKSEQILNLKNANGPQALVTLYSMLTNRLEFHLEVDGEVKTLTEDQMRSLFYSPDPVLRAEVCRELFAVYAREAPVLTQIYAHRVRDWYSDYVELRHFDSPIAIRNLGNSIPDAAVEVLLEVVQQNAPLFREFFQRKGKLLGISPLRRYDMYAPLATSDRQIPFAQAVSTVLETLHEFDPQFAQLARRLLRQGHLDSEIRKGKRGGAFCSTLSPRFTPWVLVNYAGRLRDVTTLAHELGHAIHSMLAEHHSILTQHPSLPLAETASVFCEMLINERMLAEETNPVTRREILSSLLDDIYATVMRQAYFVRFEIAAHQRVREGASADELCELYAAHLADQFGDSMVIAPEFRYEWISISHMFRTPFYCYAYSFGQLLVLALLHRYRQEGEAFKPDYFHLLRQGGARRPEEILREIGIEITDRAFWQGGFDIVRRILSELAALDPA